jgi:hypothetical protein
MKRFPKQAHIDAMIAAIPTQGEQAVKDYRQAVIDHYRPDTPAGLKAGSYKKPITEAKQALIDHGFGQFSAVLSLADLNPNHEGRKLHEKPEAVEVVEATEATEATEESYRLSERIVINREAQDAIARSGMSDEEFIIRAIAAYAKNWKPSDVDLSQIPSHELKGSKRPGAGRELCDRVIRAIIDHNHAVATDGERYQITGAILKAITGVNAPTCKEAIKAHELDLAECYEALGMDVEGGQFNRGKPPIADILGSF